MPRKRKSGDGGLYFDKQRKLWLGVIDAGYTPEGKRKQVRVSSKSQSVARQKLEALKAELSTHGSPLGTKSVAEWGAYWLESVCKPKLKPGPFRTYQWVLTKWVFPAIGRKKIKDVRPSDLRRIYDDIRQGAAPGRSGAAAALKAHNVMSAMFEAARLERLTPINVTDNIRPPKTTRTTRNAFTPDETMRILETARSWPSGSKWILSLYAGLRQGERLGATVDSLHRNLFTVQWNLVEGNYEHGCGGGCGQPGGRCPQRRLVIPEGIDYQRLRDSFMLVPPKSGEPRTFPLPMPLADMLETHIRSLGPNPYGLMWPAPDGDLINRKKDQAEWRALLEAAGVDRPGATTHWARHTAVSDLTAAGVPERVIGEVVGHRSPGITGRYQHVSSKDAQEAMARLAERRQLEA